MLFLFLSGGCQATGAATGGGGAAASGHYRLEVGLTARSLSLSLTRERGRKNGWGGRIDHRYRCFFPCPPFLLLLLLLLLLDSAVRGFQCKLCTLSPTCAVKSRDIKPKMRAPRTSHSILFSLVNRRKMKGDLLVSINSMYGNELNKWRKRESSRRHPFPFFKRKEGRKAPPRPKK